DDISQDLRAVADAGSDRDGSSMEPPFVDIPANVDLFPFFIADAEYDRVSERIVLVSDDPPGLHVYDPETRDDTAVPLPFRPWRVSVAHDGAHAVAGEYPDPGATTCRIAYVSLTNVALLKVCTAKLTLSDVVLGPADVAYVFPDYGSTGRVHSVSFADCADNDAVLQLYDNESNYGVLSPDGTAVYVAPSTITPSTIRTVTQPPDAGARWFSDQSAIDTCGRFWLTESEGDVVTECGLIYKDGSNGMPVLEGALEGYPTRDLELWSVVHSTATHRYAASALADAVSAMALGENLRIYRDSDLKVERDVPMPMLRMTEGGMSAPQPRTVMQRNDGSKYYVDTSYLAPTKNYVSAIVTVAP
ncbi:MAG TPA: hypothetical protein VKT80_15370, partial [Chloroflexota bacterium]|nr:hypothetical protein [Chloroflexota bacterium]